MRQGASVGKALGVEIESGLECERTMSESLVDATGMHIARRHQPDARMMVLVVVPGKEISRMSARVFDGSEASRKVGAILHRLEMGFGERVVVRDLGTRVRFGDAEVSEQKGDGLRHHRCSAVGVDRELVSLHALPTAAVGQKTLCKYGELAVGDHPSDDV